MKSERKGAGAGGGKVETGTHRLSRKKRRRLEKLASMDEEMEMDAVNNKKGFFLSSFSSYWF